MRNRRDFLKTVAGATAGVLVSGGGFAGMPLSRRLRPRRQSAGKYSWEANA